MIKILSKIYKKSESVVLDSGKMEITVLTNYGAKITSIKNKKSNCEFLWQEKNNTISSCKYDTDYIEGSLCGIDDMFPTICECYYPTEPWKGIKMPDHGELWSIPWDYKISNKILQMWTFGVRLPYKFEKILSFVAENILHIEYKITNLSSFNMDFIWALHPLLNIEEGSTIILPSCVSQIINTLDLNSTLGKVGTTHQWPETKDKFGMPYNISKMPAKNAGICEKFFGVGKLTEGWASLERNIVGEKITFRFPTDKVPYIGVWINSCGLKNQYNVALEPATGALDDLYVSKIFQEQAILKPKEIYEFYLDIEID